MSVMVLSKKHYQYVADTLATIGYSYLYRNKCHWDTIYKQFQYHHLDKHPKSLEFVNQLIRSNDLAYSVRYKLPLNTDSDLLTQAKDYSGKDVNAYQLLMALESISYQCNEFDNWDNTEPGKTLIKLISDLRTAIIGDTTEYQAAEWSIE